MNQSSLTLPGVGDILIDRAKPETIFHIVAPVLHSADITFDNCEQTYSDKGYPDVIHTSYSDPRHIPGLF
jgi:hypothetical protein